MSVKIIVVNVTKVNQKMIFLKKRCRKQKKHHILGLDTGGGHFYCLKNN